MSTPPDQLDEITVTSTSKAPRLPAPQFGRKYSLIVGTDSGAAVDLSQLRFRFVTKRGDFQNPNTCDVRVYNLSKQTANNLAAKEFTQLRLQAGYPGNHGLIFIGTIAQVRIGRENQLDSYVDFTAADGDEQYNYAPVITTNLVAGQNSAKNILVAILGGMKAGANSGTFSKGYIAPLPHKPLIRGKVLYGSARDHLRKLAKNNDMSWSIQDQQLTMIPLSSYIPGDPVVVSPDSGLIGVPEQTANGISMRMLLNPNVKIGQTIKLQASVNQLRLNPGVWNQGQNLNLQSGSARINGQGLYYVMVATHSGDTRGNPWYTDVICLAINADVNKSNSDFINSNFYVAGGPIKRFG
jgi:hypothetical protein